MSLDRSFAPIYTREARLLILGSLPGKRSIADQGYYAHPRNLFWSVISELTGVKPDTAYSLRIEALCDLGVALWDVAAAAERPGSLDSSIRQSTVSFNAIPELLLDCPQIGTIVFNGVASETLFKRGQKSWGVEICCRSVRLPSTSPANAGLSVQEKRTQWVWMLRQCLE